MSRIAVLAWSLIAWSVAIGVLHAQDPFSTPDPQFGQDQFTPDQFTPDQRFSPEPPVDGWASPDPRNQFGEAYLPATEGEFSPDSLTTGGTRGDRIMGSGPSGPRRAPFRAQLFGISAASLKSQPSELAVNGEALELGFPVRIEPDGIWLALGEVRRLEFETMALMPDSGLPVPDELWDIGMGMMHVRELGEGWQAGGMVRVGSPSDQPFGAWRDMTITLLAFLNVPSGPRNAWNYSLFYSPTGQIIYPIPGIAYVWRPSDQFQANLGIPFSMDYKPTETLSFSASYMPLNNIQVLARQELGELWSIYGGYRTVSETFLLDHRLNDQERFYLFDQRLTLGATRQLGGRWSLDLSAAYVFDRKMFQAEKFSGSRRDELAIDPGVAGTLQLIWTR